MLGAGILAQTYLAGVPVIAAVSVSAKGYSKASDAAANGSKASDS